MKSLPTLLLRVIAISIALCVSGAMLPAGCNHGRGRVLETAYISGRLALNH